MIRTNIFFLLILIFCLGITGCRDKTMKLNTPHNIRGVISYKRSFGDLNDLHLSSAIRIGINPLSSRAEVEALGDKLVEVKENDLYGVDSLTHSLPFLVPKASDLLSSVGSNFLDSLQSKGLNPNKIVITSILRTKDDVRKLRNRNGNASDKSAHFYATTFDVSYKRYRKIEEGRPMQDVPKDTLKLVLSEVLRDLRKAELCYIKYELKQACFHITAR